MKISVGSLRRLIAEAVKLAPCTCEQHTSSGCPLHDPRAHEYWLSKNDPSYEHCPNCGSLGTSIQHERLRDGRLRKVCTTCKWKDPNLTSDRLTPSEK